MCEFPKKLIAWLDRELPAEESAVMERHIRGCAECQSEIETYRALSETIEAYCEAAVVSDTKKRERVKPRVWRPVFVGTAAVAAAVLLFYMAKPVQRFAWKDVPAANGVASVALDKPPIPPIAPNKACAVQAVAAETPHTIRKPLGSRRMPPTASPRRSENLWLNQAPVYIAIPADALFPPGAFPEGVGFVADVNLRPDGSAQRLRLQPQLVGFQRRGAQP
jgi:anti-sigma factor RsiW